MSTAFHITVSVWWSTTGNCESHQISQLCPELTDFTRDST